MALVPRNIVTSSSALPAQEKGGSQEFDSPEMIVFEEGSNLLDEEYKMAGLVSYIKGRFEKAKSKRRTDEMRWETAYRNFRGLYGPDTQFTDTEKSRVFLKITKTKVLAAYAQVSDVLFAGGKFPIGVEATQMPEGTEELVSIDLDPNAQKAQGASPKTTMSSTVSRPAILAAIGPLADKIKEAELEPKTGSLGLPTEAIFTPAQTAAKLMEKAIHDQLSESDADKHLRSMALELPLLGHGIMKGPFTDRKEYPKWDETGEYTPFVKVVPRINYVSCWAFYPDPDARNIKECEYVFERHRMSRTDLRTLKNNTTYRAKAIDKVIDLGTNYEPEPWERVIEDNPNTFDVERYEVLEYWGMIDKQIAEENADFDIPKDLKDHDQFQVNVWICNDIIIRMIANPFKPARIPYHAVPYELNPYSFFGVGVAENMEDTQILMNGFMRMAVDNAALSGNLMIEVDENNLVPGQDMEVYPGKIWRRSGGAPGQAIFGTEFPNVAQQNMMMFDKARTLADESTGMPSYAHGGVGVAGVGRTASGMSMLMGAAAQNIKSVVRNIDDYLLSPMGKDFFSFNMQFAFDKKYTMGDLDIIARGTESLMRNEVKSQKLMQLMQVGQNPMFAPLIKWDSVLRETIGSMDLEEDRYINDPRAAAIQAQLMAKYQQALAPQTPTGPQGGPPPVSDPTGTGNGNIAPGAAPEPNAAGFTGGGGATGAGAAATQQNAQSQQGMTQ